MNRDELGSGRSSSQYSGEFLWQNPSCGPSKLLMKVGKKYDGRKESKKDSNTDYFISRDLRIWFVSF